MVDEAAFVKAQQVQTVGLVRQVIQSVASFAHLFVIVTKLGLYALVINDACVSGNLDAVMGADHVLEIRCVQKRVINDRVKVVWSNLGFFEQAKRLLALYKRLWLHDWFFLCGEVNLCLDEAIVFLEQSMGQAIKINYGAETLQYLFIYLLHISVSAFDVTLDLQNFLF